jgi:hypothetical protein
LQGSSARAEPSEISIISSVSRVSSSPIRADMDLDREKPSIDIAL